MKKFTLSVIFICILALFSAPAFAFDSDNLNSVTVYNETGFDIWYLHVSPEDSEGWGADVLGSERTLDDGEYLGFYILYPNECNSFDIMAIDEDGDSYIIWDYEFCDGYEEELEITLDDLDEEIIGVMCSDNYIQNFNKENDQLEYLRDIYDEAKQKLNN